MAVHQHVHHDDVPSASSVEEGRELELAETLLVRKMADVWDEACRPALHSFDQALILLVKGTPDDVPVL